MKEQEVFNYSSIPEENIQLASARSNLLNSPLTYLLDHTAFDHYDSEDGYRVKKVIYIKGKFKLQEQKEERKRVGFILKIEHNQRGNYFYIRIKPGANGEFNYISKGGIQKDHKFERITYPEGVNKKLEFALAHTFPKKTT